jgi:hypothetical protein
MSYPDYNTRFMTVSGDSWSKAEARKTVKAAFPKVYRVHETGLRIAWSPEAYDKDPAKKASLEDLCKKTLHGYKSNSIYCCQRCCY